MGFNGEGEKPDPPPAPSKAPPHRAPLGTLIPEQDYWQPIQEELARRGGRAPAREIIDAVGERLTGLELERKRTGRVRWEDGQHARLDLRKRGLLRSESLRDMGADRELVGPEEIPYFGAYRGIEEVRRFLGLLREAGARG